MQNKPALDTREIFFIIVIAIVGVISFFVFRPYLYSILLALIIAIAAEPLYTHLLKLFRKHSTIASIVCVLLIVFIVALPVGFFVWKVVEGVQSLYTSISSEPSSTLTQVIQVILPHSFVSTGPQIAQSIDTYIQQALSFVAQNIGPVFSGLVGMLGDILVALFSLFFILKNKTKLVALVKRMSPVSEPYDSIILTRVKESINSVIRGSLSIALLEGILYSVGFTIFGLPNPVVWGGLIALAALVPALGAGLVSVPAIAYMFLSGHVVGGIGLFAWALVSIIFIDNMLAPILINRGLRLHPIITLLAILGGVAFFGPLGFILGPVVIALFVTLLEIYAQMYKREPFL